MKNVVDSEVKKFIEHQIKSLKAKVDNLRSEFCDDLEYHQECSKKIKVMEDLIEDYQKILKDEVY